MAVFFVGGESPASSGAGEGYFQVIDGESQRRPGVDAGLLSDFAGSRDDRLAIFINITARNDTETEKRQRMRENFSDNAFLCTGTG